MRFVVSFEFESTTAAQSDVEYSTRPVFRGFLGAVTRRKGTTFFLRRFIETNEFTVY